MLAACPTREVDTDGVAVRTGEVAEALGWPVDVIEVVAARAVWPVEVVAARAVWPVEVVTARAV